MKSEMDLMRMDERQRFHWLRANRATLMVVGVVWLLMIAFELSEGRTPGFLLVMVPIFAGIVRRGAGIGPAFCFVFAAPAIHIAGSTSISARTAAPYSPPPALFPAIPADSHFPPSSLSFRV